MTDDPTTIHQEQKTSTANEVSIAIKQSQFTRSMIQQPRPPPQASTSASMRIPVKTPRQELLTLAAYSADTCRESGGYSEVSSSVLGGQSTLSVRYDFKNKRRRRGDGFGRAGNVFGSSATLQCDYTDTLNSFCKVAPDELLQYMAEEDTLSIDFSGSDYLHRT